MRETAREIAEAIVAACLAHDWAPTSTSYRGELIGSIEAALTAERERAERAERERDELAELASQPTYQCRACGSLGPFKQVVYEGTDGREYDMECSSCESTEIADSPDEAFHAVLTRLDDAEAERDTLCQHNAVLRAECQAGRVYLDAVRNARPVFASVVFAYDIARSATDEAGAMGEVSHG